MSTENTTANRGYQLPFADNELAVDVLRLISAYSAIDVDVANMLVAISQRALVDHDHVISDTTGLQAALDSKQDAAARGNANGYASLGSDGKVPAAQLPTTLFGSLNYQGDWNANTNTPTIPAAALGNKGWYYMVSIAGASSVGGITDWKVGDWAVSDGTKWVKIDNTDAVASVAGLVGVISAASLKTALAIAIADVTGLQAALNLKQDARASLGVVGQTITDWNTATSNGWYMGNGAANAPPTAIVITNAWLYGRVEAFGGGYLIQTVWPASAGILNTNTATAMRVQSGGVWGPWFKLQLSQDEQDARYLRMAADGLLTAGYKFGSYIGDGTKSGGATYMPTAAGGNMRLVGNGGAFTWAADTDATTSAYTLIVILQNTATAGAVSFSGWSAVTGDALTTANGALFICTIVKHGGVKTINIQAL